MSNIKKLGLDYFSVDTDIFSDEKMQYITAKFGCKGEAIIFRLMARIYRQGYYYQWNEDQCLLLSMSTGGSATAELIQDVVNEAGKRGFFNDEMLKKYGILTSKRIQTHYLFSTRRRKAVDMVSTFILVDLHGADILNDNVLIKELNVGNQPTKHSIEQHSTEKNKKANQNMIATDKEFQKLWDKYPRKKGEADAIRHFKAQVKTPEDLININKALDNYIAEISRRNIKEEYIKTGKTWFNQNWKDDINYTPPTKGGKNAGISPDYSKVAF